MKANYKTELRKLTKDQLSNWIDRKTDMLISIGEDGGNTPLLNKVIYAKKLLEKLK